MSIMACFQNRKTLQKVVFKLSFSIPLVSLCLATGWAQQTSGPKMVKYGFPVLNQGDQPLEIKRVQPG
jgi:hypothetical protein